MHTKRIQKPKNDSRKLITRKVFGNLIQTYYINNKHNHIELCCVNSKEMYVGMNESSPPPQTCT